MNRWLIDLLFLVAGIIHLLSPEKFLAAFPEFFPFKYVIIYVTGIFELLLSIGLTFKKTRDLSAKASALYLLLLIPVHVYVSLYQKEIFGVSSPFLLWARTFFQFVLIYLCLSLQQKGALIFQRWRDVIFFHYTVDPDEIQKHVPFPLDLYQGKAVLSVVPFRMDRIRFALFPWVPGLSALLELNLRTYVRVNGVPGVYFFTLETDSFLGEKIARHLFHLPYRLSGIFGTFSNEEITFVHERETYSFSMRGKVGKAKTPTPLERWATERYHLFLKHRGRTYRGTVVHDPWPLEEFSVEFHMDKFINQLGELKSLTLNSVTYSRKLSVSFAPFQEISS